MKRFDFLWLSIILGISSLFLFDSTRNIITNWTLNYPYLMGFIKTAILASMGEFMAMRIRTGHYFSGKGKVMKFIVWGFLGMVFVLAFKLFASGVQKAQLDGYLPMIAQTGFGASLLTAFLTSLFMNLIFAPTFMIFHRITDTYIELSGGFVKNISSIKFSTVIEHIDWQSIFRFVILTTIPLFWIPAHTITFLLPEQYRVLMAAYLSIALGIILSIAKMRKKTVTSASIKEKN